MCNRNIPIMEGDLFPMLAKWSEWQVVTGEHQLMTQMQSKERNLRRTINLNVYRRKTNLTKDMVRSADIIEYLNDQKVLNLKSATSHMAETTLINRRIEMARITIGQLERCFSVLKELCQNFETVFVTFMRSVTKAMVFEKPMDIVNRYTTLTTVKRESIREYEEIQARLQVFKEKNVAVNEERMRLMLILHNTKRENFHQLQELDESNIRIATNLKIWQANSSTTQRVLTQAQLHIEQVHFRLMAKKKKADPFKARPGTVQMLQEIGKEINRLAVLVEMVKESQRSAYNNRDPANATATSAAMAAAAADDRTSVLTPSSRNSRLPSILSTKNK